MMDRVFSSPCILSLVFALSLVWSHPTSDLKADELIANFVTSLVIKHDSELRKLEEVISKSEDRQELQDKVIQKLQEEARQSNERQGEVISQLKAEITQLSDKEHAVSSTYTRWGRKGCPTSSGAKLVYTGYAAGSFYNEEGGGSNYVCLTDTPQWKYTQEQYNAGKTPYVANIYGAEYEFYVTWPFTGDNIPGGSPFQHDVPCAVCETTGRSTVLMIPGTYKCPGGWQKEYQGYLSAAYHGFKRSEFVCVDGNPDALPEGSENIDGALFYYAIVKCGALRCPPYINDREVTCVVCSK